MFYLRHKSQSTGVETTQLLGEYYSHKSYIKTSVEYQEDNLKGYIMDDQGNKISLSREIDYYVMTHQGSTLTKY